MPNALANNIITLLQDMTAVSIAMMMMMMMMMMLMVVLGD